MENKKEFLEEDAIDAEESKRLIRKLIDTHLEMFAKHSADVRITDGIDCTIVEVVPHQEDCGRLIGVHGRVAQGVRYLINAFSARINRTILYRVVTPEDNKGKRFGGDFYQRPNRGYSPRYERGYNRNYSSYGEEEDLG